MTPFYNPTTSTFYPHITGLPRAPLYNGRELCELSEAEKIAAGYWPAVLLPELAYDPATQYLDGYSAVLDDGGYYEVAPVVVDKSTEQIAAEQAALDAAIVAQEKESARAKLQELDSKSIRALREIALGQTESAVYLQQYETLAAQYRALLTIDPSDFPANDYGDFVATGNDV